MPKYILFSVFLFLSNTLVAQNLISNPDFEDHTTCPTTLGYVGYATNWYGIVVDADYYSCGFRAQESYYTPDTSAFSGISYIGFSLYGDSVGFSESVGQDISNPLVPGHSYKFNFAVKKADTGLYSSTCGGLALYGSKNYMPDDTFGFHISSLPYVVLLGNTDNIANISWKTGSFSFIPTDTIKHIALSVTKVPNCAQHIFVDSLSLVELTTESTGLSKEMTDFISIYPMPATRSCTVKYTLKAPLKNIALHSIDGKSIMLTVTEQNSHELTLSNLPIGTFILSLQDILGNTFRKQVVIVN